MAFNITFVGTVNFRKGRNGRKIVAIVDHITAGQYPGCLTWLQNPKAQASANYLITREGKILQLVKDEDTAWANGAVSKPTWALYDGTNPNTYTMSIEHEGFGAQGGDGKLTEVQYQASLWLHKQLTKKWNLPIDNEHIIGHYRIDGVNRPNCPGKNFPWERLFKDLRNEVVEVALEKWMLEGGQAAVKNLAAKGLLNNPEQWIDKKVLEKPFPTYLAFMMLDRLADYKKGK